MLGTHEIFSMEFTYAMHRTRQGEAFETKLRKCDSLVFYLQGGHTYEIAGSRKYAGEGELVYIPSKITYMNYPSRPDLEYYQIEFRIFNEQGKQLQLFDEWLSFSPDKVQELLVSFREIYEIYEQMSSNVRWRCTELLSRILCRVIALRYGEISKYTERYGMNAVRDYIEKNYRLNTTVAELAQIASVSVSSLERGFSRTFGCTPIAYRNRLRVERGKLLLAGGMNVTESANLVGFSDVFYFSRIFKKLCGISPSEYISSLG